MKAIIYKVGQLHKECSPLKHLKIRAWSDAERTVRIEAKNNRFTVTSTNFNVTVSIRCSGVRVIEPGACNVDRNKFFEIIATHKSDHKLNISTSGPVLQFGSSRLLIQPECLFPTIHDKSLIPYTVLTKEMIQDVSYAAGENDTRYTLNAVCVDLQRSNLVATNGHRLAIRQINGKADMPQILIPNEAIKMMSDIGDKFLLCGIKDRDKKVLKCQHSLIQFKPIEGIYPHYRQIIPSLRPNIITVNRMRLVKGLKQLISVKPQSSAVYIRNNNLILAATGRDLDTARIELPCAYTCDPLAGFSINPQYLLDSIKDLKLVTVCLDFDTLTNPISDRSTYPITIRDTRGTAYGLIMEVRGDGECGYKPDPDDALYVETVNWIDDRLRKTVHDRRLARRKKRVIQREVRRLLSTPLHEYEPKYPANDDVKLEFRGDIITNTGVDILGLIYPGWKWRIKGGWLHTDKLVSMPNKDELRKRVAEYYRHITTIIDFWGIKGFLGDVLTIKQFNKVVNERGTKIMEMVEKAREEKKCIRIKFLTKELDDRRRLTTKNHEEAADDLMQRVAGYVESRYGNTPPENDGDLESVIDANDPEGAALLEEIRKF